MPDSFIVNVCLTGMVARKEHNANVPMTPDEIAADAAACIEHGASMLHVHARDEDQEPDWRTEPYQAIVDAIREVSEDVIICVSTSGRREQAVERRTACLDTDPAPDMASLTLSSINFKKEGVLNTPETVLALVERMRERNVKPELEVFDIGMARAAGRLLSQGIVDAPGYANVLLGNVGTAATSAADLAAILSHFPDDLTWCAAGIARAQARANALGLALGDGVRVGLEDNLYLHPGKEPTSNPELVRRAVEMGRLLGREPASIAETRVRLGLGTPGA